MADIAALIADPQFKALAAPRKRAVLQAAGAPAGFIDEYLAPKGVAAMAGAERISQTPWYQREIPVSRILSLGMKGPEGLENASPKVSVEDALQALPATSGALGGLIGAGVGTAAVPGGGTILAGAKGAALGGAAGEAARQLARRAIGASAPATSLDAAGKIASEAALQGGAELTGGLIGRGMTGGAERLMQSAVKPTLKMAPNTPKIVQTMLDEGINVSPRGLERLNMLLEAKNTEIADAVQASHGLISKADVAARTQPLMERLSQQVNPQADVEAVRKVTEGFMEGPTHLLVPQAQAMKQGTYRQLAKKYGEMSSASVEAEKALARGLKEEIAKEVPSIAGLNAEESALIATKEALGRRVAMSGNRDPVGFAWVTSHPTTFLAALIDRAPAVKSMLARGMYSSAGAAAKVSPQLIRAAAVALATNADASSETESSPAPQ